MKIKSGSIRSKILFWGLIAVFLTALLLGAYAFNNQRNHLIHDAENTLYNVGFLKAEKISDTINFAIKTNINLKNGILAIRDFSYKEDFRTLVEDLINKVISNSNNFVGFNNVWEKDAFDSKDSDENNIEKYGETGTFATYHERIGNEVVTKQIQIEQFHNWYELVKETKETVFADPYLYPIAGKEELIISVFEPILVNGEYLGFVGGDITVDFIQESLPTGDAFGGLEEIQIISSNGVIVASTEESLISTQFSDYENVLDSLSGRTRLIGTQDDLVSCYIPIKFINTYKEWILKISVPESYFLNQANSLLLAFILITALIVFGVFILLWFVTGRISKPLVDFTNNIGIIKTEGILEADFIDDKSSIKEINSLSESFNKMYNALQENFRLRENEKWIQQKQIELNSETNSIEDMKILSKKIITLVTKYLNGHVGALYFFEKFEGNDYKYYAGYGVEKDSNFIQRFKEGEGLSGETVLDQKIKYLRDIPDDFLKVNTTTGSTKAKSLLIIPCVYDNEVKAIIEVGSLCDFTSLQIDLIKRISTSIAVVLTGIMNLTRTKHLLDKVEKQAEELQAQQEELRVSNEELEQQTETLKRSEDALQRQREELEVNNEELEEKSELLEKQKKELELNNRKLIEIQEELKKSNTYKSQFLANMSHELRTPLNSIMMLSDLLKSNHEKHLTDKEVEYAKIINSSGNDLINLIDDILDISKLEAKGMEVYYEDIEIKDFTKSIRNLFNKQYEKKGIKLNIILDEGTPNMIIGDLKKLKQIVSNLLSNSLKFTEQGEVILRIFRDMDSIVFQVKDTGIGISKNRQRDIFESFKQEDGSIERNYSGTGLGLAISRELAILMNGDLTLVSEKGKGSVFSLILPLLDLNKSESNINKIQKGILNKNDRNGTETVISSEEEIPDYVDDDRMNIKNGDKTILIIDDDPVFIKSVKELINEKGFKLFAAKTGEHGLFIADYYNPTAIILDIKLPTINGYEVMERMKGNPKTSDIPVFLISAYEEESKKSKSAANFIRKPLSIKKINNLINQIDKLSKRVLNKVLILGEDEKQKDNIKKYLKNSKSEIEVHECDLCTSCSVALENMIDKKYDCLIIDLQLKDCDVKELIKTIRKNEQISFVPIIIYTSADIDEEEENELRKDVQEIIIVGEESKKRLLDEINHFLLDIKLHYDKGETKNYDKDDSFKDKTILLVDDDMRNVFTLMSVLEPKGIDVITANNGLKAIEKLEENENIDLVIMDIMMPVMNGYEAMREIRKIKKFESLPIIALTAKAMKGDREKCLESGANDYLQKPLDVNKLFSILRVWLYK